MSRRVLIAEDSRTQREVLRAQLEDAGYQVETAADGHEALHHIAHQHFDILISDVVMPGMDGYELCREAKRRAPRLPVILLTSMNDPLDVVRGLQAGADNFLRKPYDFSHLRARTEMMLHNQHMRDTGQIQMGLELFFLNQRFMITAERQQILDLLVSTFEDLVVSNEQLRRQEAELASARDELAHQLAAAEAQQRRLDAVLRAVPDAMVMVDADCLVTGASEALAALVGTPTADELKGRPVGQLLRLLQHTGEELPFDERKLPRALREGKPVRLGRAFNVLAERPGGARVPVLLHAAPVLDTNGRATGAVGIVHELEALSLHDPLTHLPGHRAFAQQVDEAVDVSTGNAQLVAVLVAVVDRRRDLCESLGKDRADRLAVDLAQRLQEALELPLVRQHTTDPTPAFLGDLEYAAVLPRLVDEAAGVRIAEAIRRHVGGTHYVDDLEVPVNLTVGFAATAEAGTRAEQLVPAAAAAAHAGTRRGGDRVESSDPGAAERAANRLREEADLRRGIEQGEFEVHYQPVMSLAGGVAGVEALVRWQHPERGVRPPADFIPLAEVSGLVVPLGWQVLHESCWQVARWRKELPAAEDLVVSVNLSPRQLTQGDVAARVEAALRGSGLPPHALCLEITEAGVVEDVEAAAAQLHLLRSIGVRIAVDDFGTGYASLLQLRTLPVDSLKVDRQFVDGLLSDSDDAVIVTATVSLALALRLTVVAEGVETPEQAEELRRLGCDFGQGFLWSRALAPAAFEQWWTRCLLRDDAPSELCGHHA